MMVSLFLVFGFFGFFVWVGMGGEDAEGRVGRGADRRAGGLIREIGQQVG
jgi:hypothetical protein